jgi:hypothetical protein
MLRAIAEFCPHCGLSLPRSFPYNQLVPADTRRVMQALKAEVVPQRPMRVEIAARYLILVARDRVDLFEYLQQKFVTEIDVEVRYERRMSERRQRPAVKPLDRRRRDRRTKPPLNAELRRFGFAIISREEGRPVNAHP